MSNPLKPSPFKLTYELTGAGWAHSVIEVRGKRVEMSVSYLHDTLEQLASAALHLVRSESFQEEVIFMDEPGEYQLALKREADLLIASLTQFEDWKSWGMFDESKHKIRKLIEFEVSIKKFAMEVLNVLFRLYEQHGLDGYKAKWVEAEFPFAKYQALEAAIKAYR